MSQFINTDVDLAFDVEKGFTIDDALDASFVFSNGQFTIKKDLGQGVEKVEDYFVVSIYKGEIASPGAYEIYVRITDTSGRQRGLKVSPASIKFIAFPVE